MDAVPGHSVHVRRFQEWVAHEPHRVEAVIIRKNEHHVSRFGSLDPGEVQVGFLRLNFRASEQGNQGGESAVRTVIVANPRVVRSGVEVV